MITKPFSLETGTLEVFDPRGKKRRKPYTEIEAGEPEMIVMWTPLKETTLVFIKYSDYLSLIQFELKNEDVDDFNTWFKETYNNE